MVRMTYEEARAVIQDGDIVFVHGSWRSMFSTAVMLATASPLSHVCIAFWVNVPHGRLLVCVEAQNRTRQRVIPLSLYANARFTVVAAPTDWSTVRARALCDVGKRRYGLLAAMYVGLREFVHRHTGYQLPQKNLTEEFCSAFVAKVYQLECMDGSPRTLYEHLLQLTQVRGLPEK